MKVEKEIRIFVSILVVFEEESSSADCKSRPYKESFEGFINRGTNGTELCFEVKSNCPRYFNVLSSSFWEEGGMSTRRAELSHFRRLL